MKYFLVIIVMFFQCSSAFSSQIDSLWNNNIYQNAYNSILDMLEGKAKLDFKKAVFISENVYYNDSLEYSGFCDQIDSIESKVKWLIKAKRIEHFKTATHYAIYSYMCEPSVINDSLPMKYDFNDFMGYDKWSNQFVTKLLNTKKGNCHSLPFLYKILGEEMGIDVHIASAPSHVYIKHIDESGKWVNIELTNGGGFPSDAWIISSMGITAEAIRNGTYMKPLTLEESIAFCLYDLAMGYKEKNGYDATLEMMCSKVLEYYPNCIMAYMLKADCITQNILDSNKKKDPITSMYVDLRKNQHVEIVRRIKLLGHREMRKEEYEKWQKDMKDEIYKDKNVNNSTKGN